MRGFSAFTQTNYDGHPADAIREVGTLHGVEVRVYASAQNGRAIAQAVVGGRIIARSVFEVSTAAEASARVKSAASGLLRSRRGSRA